jgi:hypothetical protein
MTEEELQAIINQAIANTWLLAAIEIAKCRKHGNDNNWCAAGLGIEFEQYAEEALKARGDVTK